MDLHKLQAELRKSRRQLILLYELGNLMRTTLKLDEIIYLVLSAVTSHEGLGFNRAILFLADENRLELRGVFGIGPKEPKESMSVWQDIGEHKLHLIGFLDVYRKQKGRIDTELNKIVSHFRVRLQRESSLLAQSILDCKPISILTDADRAGCHEPLLQKLQIGHFVIIPIKGKDEVIGALLVDNISTKKPITKDEIRDLSMMCDHAGLAIENAMIFTHVLEVSRKDSLTELWNHAHFQELLSQSLQVARLQNHSLSLVIFDVDDFKKYNDLLGHPQGDHALRFIAQIARKTLRRNDYVARYGGEEFAIIFPGLTKNEACHLTNKLKNEIREQSKGLFSSNLIKSVTISGGVSSFPDDADDREKLIYCADAALYEAKKQGKDRIVIYKKV